jgi:hypothetical protein
MARFGFKYCALHYLNEWLRVERSRWLALKNGNENEKLIALSEFAFDYRIARNLSGKYDKNHPITKYKAVLPIIDGVHIGQFCRASVVPSVLDIAAQISQQYGGRGVLSTTTKFLWLKMPSKIIIYNSRARKSLGTKSGDLEAYCSKWRNAYRLYASDVNAACATLLDVRDYLVDTRAASNKYVGAITSNRWFKRRVFDVYLWHRTRPLRRTSKLSIQ